MAGQLNGALFPLRLALVIQIKGQITVQGQNAQCDIFADHLADAGGNHANDLHMVRQGLKIELIHARTDRNQQLDIRISLKQIIGGNPAGDETDSGQILYFVNAIPERNIR